MNHLSIISIVGMEDLRSSLDLHFSFSSRPSLISFILNSSQEKDSSFSGCIEYCIID